MNASVFLGNLFRLLDMFNVRKPLQVCTAAGFVSGTMRHFFLLSFKKRLCLFYTQFYVVLTC